jgi:MFS family permease
MAGAGAAQGYDVRRQVRVLNLVAGLLNLNPHVVVWVVYLTEFRGISLALEIPSSAISDRYGRKIGFLIVTAIEGVGVLMFALAGGFPLLMVLYVLWGGGIAFRSGNDGAFMYDVLSVDGR